MKAHGCHQEQRWLVAEVKTATGKQSRVQVNVTAPWPIWRSVDDALAGIRVAVKGRN